MIRSLFVLFGITLLSVAADPPAKSPYSKPTCIAHRGASYAAPEHTIAAYKLALDQGADFVEPDLQLTKDGQLICLHDETLERTTNVATKFPGRGVIAKGKTVYPASSFTLAEIRTLDAGSWKSEKFMGEKVPTFREMIDLVKGKAGIIPETKSPETYGRLGMDMEKAVMAELSAANLAEPGADPKTPVIIQSFSAESLKLMRGKYGCRLPLVYLWSSREPATKEFLAKVRTFADGVAPNKSVVLNRPQLVADAHALGMSVTIWTCREGSTGKFQNVKEEMAHFRNDLKVDAIFTDNPDQFPRK